MQGYSGYNRWHDAVSLHSRIQQRNLKREAELVTTGADHGRQRVEKLKLPVSGLSILQLLQLDCKRGKPNACAIAGI